jgi:hypothetical protein
MKLVLYQRKDERIWCTITADLSGGKLSVSGHDLGPQVEEFFGRDEYEYAVSLNTDNTRRLFESLGCTGEPDEKKLQVIKDTFENSRADSALKEYCAERGIETSFWCWP